MKETGWDKVSQTDVTDLHYQYLSETSWSKTCEWSFVTLRFVAQMYWKLNRAEWCEDLLMKKNRSIKNDGVISLL